MTRVALTAIYSQCNDRIMGVNGELPIKLRADMKMFISATEGNHCIMGRKTWESLPESMKVNKRGRTYYVLTKDHLYCPGHGAIPIYDLHTFLVMMYTVAPMVYLLGGADILQQYQDVCDTLMVTDINYDVDVKEGDSLSFAPMINPGKFRLYVKSPLLSEKLKGSEVGFEFKTYVKIEDRKN